MSDAIVETRSGKVRGVSRDAVSVWKGIPFAQPPLGALRFRPPLPPDPWTDVRDATKFGPIAPQVSAPLSALFGSGNADIPTGEDCLYLNVWSPAADGKKRPVLVWIHGGGFVGGSGSTPWYDGTSFAARGDIVVVTLNYRLGVLGFLYLGEVVGEEYASGNYGLLDQIAVLEWVRDNIAAFGGDPGNVTIVGESAGAMSVGVLLAMPAAQGLFHKAILQSGASHGVPDREIATKVAREILAHLGTEDITSLQNLPVATILEAQAKLSRRRGLLSLRPVVDGVTLPTRPFDALANGAASGVSVLIGSNRDEMKLFTAMDAQQGKVDEAVLKQTFGDAASKVLATYAAAHPGASDEEAWADILTDRTFRIPAIRLAECLAQRGTPVWMYRFDWRSPAFEGRLGACHALEIPFVWNNLNRPGVPAFTGDSPTRQPLADKMHATWIDFMFMGNPIVPDAPRWPAYDTKRRATMIFNDECQVIDDPQSAERRLWDGVL
ncbi:MAG TPA: carboxylesterase/lipase family protein [Ktedonobacteraceae bacterium]|nr:carboxylesterase/lipase family protein [Ktedonobacteraceae bacterium]